MKKSLTNELQTPATDGKSADQARYEAGHGGSYAMDPVTGQVTLLHATEGASVSRKHPDAPRNLPASDAAAPAADGGPVATE